MRRPPRPGAPRKLIMQTNCAALIFIRHRKRPIRGARRVLSRAFPDESGCDRWFRGRKVRRGRAGADGARAERGNRENVEESLLSSAIRLQYKRAVYTWREI